ncbi:MAG TPA: ATP-dependent Clp protease ATP-binding subunit ClpX, partial [Chloroflexota bacterium]|nr:ATP-dependent Clp protease ATP-binding subunit ClpX [Chloroflexota bacterium]
DKRLGSKKSIGFGRDSLSGNNRQKREEENVLHKLIPDDLLKYGLIPEFVGRLPVTVALDELEQDDLVRILTEPKNAIIKQYQKFLALDKVELILTPDALRAAAELALSQKTGARGLRTIVEETLTDVMFDIPSMEGARKCVVDDEVIRGNRKPILLGRADAELIPGEGESA